MISCIRYKELVFFIVKCNEERKVFMAVKLMKGQKVNLRKDNPNLERILIGLGWDPEEIQKQGRKDSGVLGKLKTFLGITSESRQSESQWSKPKIDIDSSVIILGENNVCKNTVYFGNLEAYNGAILHNGDDLTGEGETGADDEQIEIYLDQIPKDIQILSIIINIFNAYSRHQTFEQIANCFVHVTDMKSGKELVRYDIDGEFSGMTGIFVADLERSGNDWHFKAIGEGVKVANIDEMVQIKCKQK